MKFLKHAATWAVAAVLPLASVAAVHAATQIDQVEPEAQIEVPDITTPDKAPTVIDKTVVGWNGVALSAKGERVYSGLRASWVMLNDVGGIDGRVVGISKPIQVYLLRNGFVVGRATTDVDGSFRMESATPGPYSIVGHSPESFFSYGFNAVANDGEATAMPATIQTTPIIGVENNRLVTKLVKKYSPQVNFRTYGKYDVGETKADPAKYYGFAGLRNLTEAASPATSVASHAVTLGLNGSFVGRFHQVDDQSGRPVEILNTRVTLVSDGQVVAEAQTDQAGTFEFTNVQPGSYGVIASGNDGFAALGVDLVANNGIGAPSTVSPDLENEIASNGYNPLFSLTSFSNVVDSSQSFDACLCSPESMGWINSHVMDESYANVMDEPLLEMGNVGDMPYDYFDQSMMYGDMGGYGSGGGFGGGGGGGFGGGGLGGFGSLILPLGLGAIIAEAVDDDNNLNGGVRVVSPFDP